MKAIRPWLLASLLACLAACTQKQSESAAVAAAPAAPTLTALATTRQVMLGITVPTSDALFGVGEKPPEDDAAWEKIQASAISLAESANLLRIDGRRVDTQDWLKYVDALVATSQVAAQAAQEKNVDKVLDAGNQIYEVCDSCHKKYLAARGGV
jgi:cytochrome c556